MNTLQSKIVIAVHAGGAALGAILAVPLILIALLSATIAKGSYYLADKLQADTKNLVRRVQEEL